MFMVIVLFRSFYLIINKSKYIQNRTLKLSELREVVRFMDHKVWMYLLSALYSINQMRCFDSHIQLSTSEGTSLSSSPWPGQVEFKQKMIVLNNNKKNLEQNSIVNVFNIIFYLYFTFTRSTNTTCKSSEVTKSTI